MTQQINYLEISEDLLFNHILSDMNLTELEKSKMIDDGNVSDFAETLKQMHESMGNKDFPINDLKLLSKLLQQIS